VGVEGDEDLGFEVLLLFFACFALEEGVDIYKCNISFLLDAQNLVL